MIDIGVAEVLTCPFADEIKRDEIDVKKLSNDMFETMENADGIGLAAPQIGISKRIFVIDGTMLEDEQMKNFKNAQNS